jgi:hypothetical protein
LLLLATFCGLAILVAGGVLLLKLSNQTEQPLEDVGSVVHVGDMTVTVERVAERNGSMMVSVEIGGVDDAEGSNAFRLVVPGKVLVADPTAGDHCGATSVQVQPCTLAFRLPDDSGSSRVLLYQRGDNRARWDLGAA